MTEPEITSDARADGKTVLFLGYGPDETRLIEALQTAGCDVIHEDGVVEDLDADLVVSFGYRHILKPAQLATARGPVFNLHISYLPYNRGAHPNFWSFYDGTPAGVTIHLIDAGIDTGPIVAQSLVSFDAGETTFRQTQARLLREIEDLFLETLDAILDGSWKATPQTGTGTLHSLRDLPAAFSGWDSEIAPEIAGLKAMDTPPTE